MFLQVSLKLHIHGIVIISEGGGGEGVAEGSFG